MQVYVGSYTHCFFGTRLLLSENTLKAKVLRDLPHTGIPVQFGATVLSRHETVVQSEKKE